MLLPFAWIQPLAALGATIDTTSLRNPIFLITPVVHSRSPRQRNRQKTPHAEQQTFLPSCALPQYATSFKQKREIGNWRQDEVGQMKPPRSRVPSALQAERNKAQKLAVLLRHGFTLFFGQRSEVGFPSRAPADVPFPHAAQDGSRIPVVPGSEAAFLAIAHGFIPDRSRHSPKPMPQVDTK